LNLETGELAAPELAAEISSPGFLALHPNGTRLYSLCRLPQSQSGGVAAYAIAAEDGSLTLLNTQPIGSGGAAHLAVERTARCLFTAQYGDGSVAVFRLDENGKILPRSDLVRHQGSGPNPARQRGPHPHWVGTDLANRFLFVPDLGIDQVVIYRTDLDAGRIVHHGRGSCPPGGGPRHMKFHPNGRVAYVLNELQMTITVFQYDPQAGTLDARQTISTLPRDLQEIANKASEIRVHPSGRFVYAANRGHDSIAAFKVDMSTGELTFIEREAIRGSWPRNFNIDPSGQWLLAAGRDSNTIAVFAIDTATGGLVFSGKIVNCPTPICIEFGAAS
jgi:6-phosphogluconolactonase